MFFVFEVFLNAFLKLNATDILFSNIGHCFPTISPIPVFYCLQINTEIVDENINEIQQQKTLPDTADSQANRKKKLIRDY